MPASSFQFLHAADLHIDSPLRGLVRRGEVAGAFIHASRRALENLVATAIREKVAFVIIAGDIYDGNWRDYTTGHFFVRQMGHLAREGIRVFLIRGNHDAKSVITKDLPLPSNVRSFSVRGVESLRIEELGVVLHGRGFAHRHVSDNVALSYPSAEPGYFNIGVLHTSLTGREGHDVYAPCTIGDLRRHGYDYWALGHVHRREIVEEDPPIVFPGNLQGRHARESGPKGATLVSVADGRVADLEAMVLDAARFEHIELVLSGMTEIAHLMQEARRAIAEAREGAAGRPLALRLTFKGKTALHEHLSAQAEQVSEEMQALAWEAGDDVLIEKVRNTTSSLGDGHAMSAITGFDEILSAVAADPAFQADIARTLTDLRSKTPADVLELLGFNSGDIGSIATSAITTAEDVVLAGLNGIAPPEVEAAQ